MPPELPQAVPQALKRQDLPARTDHRDANMKVPVKVRRNAARAATADVMRALETKAVKVASHAKATGLRMAGAIPGEQPRTGG